MKVSRKKRIRQACNLLSILKVLKPEQCQELFSNFSDNGIEFFSEIIFNLLHSKFKLKNNKKNFIRKKIQKHLPQLKKLSVKASNEKEIKKKRKILKQRGAGVIIPLIASTVAPLLINLIKKQFSKK